VEKVIKLKKNFLKKISIKGTMALLVLSLVILTGCVPPPNIEPPYRPPVVDYHYQLMVEHIYEDPHLVHSGIYVTSPEKGVYAIRSGEVVHLRSNQFEYYVASWIIVDSVTGRSYVVENAYYDLVMNQDYAVFANLRCAQDQACLKGYSCIENTCTLTDFPNVEVISSLLYEQDVQLIGNFKVVLEEITDKSVVVNVNGFTDQVYVGEEKKFFHPYLNNEYLLVLPHRVEYVPIYPNCDDAVLNEVVIGLDLLEPITFNLEEGDRFEIEAMPPMIYSGEIITLSPNTATMTLNKVIGHLRLRRPYTLFSPELIVNYREFNQNYNRGIFDFTLTKPKEVSLNVHDSISFFGTNISLIAIPADNSAVFNINGQELNMTLYEKHILYENNLEIEFRSKLAENCQPIQIKEVAFITFTIGSN